MERIELTIRQEHDTDTLGTIQVVGYRNGQPCFVENFKSNTSTAYPIQALSDEQIEGTTDAPSSVSATLLSSMLADIRESTKTGSKALYAHFPSKFQLNTLIDVKRFEKLANVKFDYSKFSNLQEFQRYFKSLLK